ncbi:MAG: hypothetical protein ABJQ70_02860 [Roseobacter sp.]
MLFNAGQSITARREALKGSLLTSALMFHSGDRGALRKQLSSASLVELFNVVDVENLKPVNTGHKALAWAQLIEAYWLNGCTVEVVGMLDEFSVDVSQSFYLIAVGRTPQWPERIWRNVGSPDDLRYKVVQSLIETPENAELILSKTLARYESEAEALGSGPYWDATGVGVALDLVRGVEPSFVAPQLPDAPSKSDYLLYYLEWASIATWPSLSGNCEAVSDLSDDLVKTPNDLTYSFMRSLHEASYIRCMNPQQ